MGAYGFRRVYKDNTPPTSHDLVSFNCSNVPTVSLQNGNMYQENDLHNYVLTLTAYICRNEQTTGDI
jgi:hypothetical protein